MKRIGTPQRTARHSQLLHAGTRALALCAITSASPWTTAPSAQAGAIQMDRFDANVTQNSYNFGYDVSIDGTTVLAGARGDSLNGTNAGAAYLFDVTTGQQGFVLRPDDGQTGDLFGSSVGIDGGFAVIGANGNDTNGDSAGAAYLFDVTTGQQRFRLAPDVPVAGAQLGEDVDIDGATAIVGARTERIGADFGFNAGAAYLFDVATGAQRHRLVPDDLAGGDQFGESVALDADSATAIVGATRANDAKGAAYLFDLNTGQQLRQLTADDGAASDDFGSSVAIDGSLAVVTATSHGNGGAAYVFDITTGDQVAKFTASDARDGDFLGNSVALSGRIAVVGAHLNDDNFRDAGSAYFFDALTGEEIDKVLASDPGFADRFGFGVDIDQGFGLIGAPQAEDDPVAFSLGAAYLFEVTIDDDDQDGDLDGDGRVAQGDLNLVLNNWGQPRGNWNNADGFSTLAVDQEELNAVLNNWGAQASSPLVGSNVPEPAAAIGVWLLLVAGGRRPPERARALA